MPKRTIKWTPYLATAYAEGFCEGENATASERIAAYQYLINNNIISRLQGSFGRVASDLISAGLCKKNNERNL